MKKILGLFIFIVSTFLNLYSLNAYDVSLEVDGDNKSVAKQIANQLSSYFTIKKSHKVYTGDEKKFYDLLVKSNIHYNSEIWLASLWYNINHNEENIIDSMVSKFTKLNTSQKQKLLAPGCNL